MKYLRDWKRLREKHEAFWECGEYGNIPLLAVNFKYVTDPERTAALLSNPETDTLLPDSIAPSLAYNDYLEMFRTHEELGDDYIAPCDPFAGVPWLEAMAGCRVRIPQGKSIWPEPPLLEDPLSDLLLAEDNPWRKRLMDVVENTSAFAEAEGIPNSATHLRGPTDIFAARMGTQELFLALMDSSERMGELALQAAEMYRSTAEGELSFIKPWREGYVIRQFGLWSPEPSVWLQEDTSGMMSRGQYEKVFLPAFRKMSVFPYGVLHLHIHSLHQAEMFAEIPGVRCVNLYFDDKRTKVASALSIIKNLQKKKIALILAKDIYDGFSLGEYREIMENLSPAGLSIHLDAKSESEGKEVLSAIRGKPFD